MGSKNIEIWAKVEIKFCPVKNEIYVYFNFRLWAARFRPWKLIYSKEFESKTEAMIYEKWLK